MKFRHFGRSKKILFLIPFGIAAAYGFLAAFPLTDKQEEAVRNSLGNEELNFEQANLLGSKGNKVVPPTSQPPEKTYCGELEEHASADKKEDYFAGLADPNVAIPSPTKPEADNTSTNSAPSGEKPENAFEANSSQIFSSNPASGAIAPAHQSIQPITNLLSGNRNPASSADSTTVISIPKSDSPYRPAFRNRGIRLVDAAIAKKSAIEEAATDDIETVNEPYTNMPVEVLSKAFERATENITESIDILDKAESGLEKSERARFKNLYINARDKAMIGRQILGDEEQKRAIDLTDLSKQLLKNPKHPLSKTAGLQDLFGSDSPLSKPTSDDALVDRIAMYNGLPKKDRQKLLEKLSLVEQPKMRLKDGSSKQLELLHNGYIFGAGTTSTDCSAFISSILPADMRKTQFTTLDFQSMWSYLDTGKVPTPPTWPHNRDKLIQKVASGFTPVYHEKGEALMPGDLLVYRSRFRAMGHIFLIKKYDKEKYLARVLEAAQSAGTVRERDFSMVYRTSKSPQLYYRPGFVVLRLKQEKNNQACGYNVAAVSKRPGR